MISGKWNCEPVMLPPGRARLGTIPIVTASPISATTIGIVVVAPCAGSRRSIGHEHIRPKLDQLVREARQAIVPALGPAVLDDEVLALLVTEVAKSLAQGREPRNVRARRETQESYPVHPPIVLRPSGERRGKPHWPAR